MTQITDEKNQTRNPLLWLRHQLLVEGDAALACAFGSGVTIFSAC
jgi:hypothetical protein